MNYLKIVLIVVLIIILILLLIIRFLFPFVNYLSRPDNVRAAARLGEELVNVRGKNILVVTAHPDDAEWYAGGTLLRLAENNNVYLILGTSGEEGGDQVNLDKKREKLQLEASKVMGYKGTVFLRHLDRGLIADGEFKNELQRAIDKYNADLIFTFDYEKPGYIYRHSDHMAAGKAVLEIADEYPLKLYLFHSNDNNVIVDYTPVKEKKRNALQIVGNYGGRGPGFLRWLPLGRDQRRRFSTGYGQSFEEVGIEDGELFRKVSNRR